MKHETMPNVTCPRGWGCVICEPHELPRVTSRDLATDRDRRRADRVLLWVLAVTFVCGVAVGVCL